MGRLPRPSPCPFCGEEPDTHISEGNAGWSVSCSGSADEEHPMEHELCIDGKTEVDAILKWNVAVPKHEFVTTKDGEELRTMDCGVCKHIKRVRDLGYILADGQDNRKYYPCIRHPSILVHERQAMCKEGEIDEYWLCM